MQSAVPFAQQRARGRSQGVSWASGAGGYNPPAAGRASTDDKQADAGAGGFPGHHARPDDTSHLQSALSSLMIDKEKLENDMRKVSSKARSRAQLEQKRELEIEIDLVNRNVQNLRTRLRERKAL